MGQYIYNTLSLLLEFQISKMSYPNVRPRKNRDLTFTVVIFGATVLFTKNQLEDRSWTHP